MRRTIAACVVTALVVGGGTATAAKLITGKQIANGSVTGADIKNRSLRGKDVRNSSLTGRHVKSGSLTGSDIRNGTVGMNDLSPAVRAALSNPAQQGPKGDKGDTGAKGAAGPKGDAGSTTLVTPDNGLFGTTDGHGDTSGRVWDSDTFECPDPSTGEQGFVNGVSRLFDGENSPQGSGAYFMRNGGQDCVRVVDLNSLEGVALKDLSELRYSEIFADQDADNTVAAPYVQIRVDRNGGTVQPGDVDVLFFIPANQGGDVHEGVWQTWNVLPGRFGVGGDANYTSLADYRAAHPNATLRASDFQGAIRFVAGAGISTADGYTAAVDNVVTAATGRDRVIYDFEAQ